MKKQFDLIVFDWDGTLMDSTAHVVKSMLLAFQELALPLPSEAAVRGIMGLSLAKGIQLIAPQLTQEMIERVIDRYRFYYFTKDWHPVLFPGVLEMLKSLQQRGFYLAVATGKSRVGLDDAMAKTGTAAYFAITRCADETFSKPHPAMLNEIMGTLLVKPNRTLMIGDTSHDLQLAANANVNSVGVTFGAHSKAYLSTFPSLYLASSIDDLTRWFEKQID